MPETAVNVLAVRSGLGTAAAAKLHQGPTKRVASIPYMVYTTAPTWLVPIATTQQASAPAPRNPHKLCPQR